MINKKEVLLKAIDASRFGSVSEEVFKLYDDCEALCDPVKDANGLLNLAFYRGEAYFRMGEYEKAQEVINNCLLVHAEPIPPDLSAKCHNTLGLIYSAMGYQMVSLENYLSALDFSIRADDSRQKTVIYINMGWLYRDLGDYEKALFCYYQALKEFNYTDSNGFYSLKTLAYSYIGQIYFKTARFQEALDILDIIEKLISTSTEDFYYISISNMRVRAYHYLEDYEKLDQAIDEIIEKSDSASDFLEYSADYLDVCQYIMEFCDVRSRVLIDKLRGNIKKTPSHFLLLNLQKLEVAYMKKYNDKDSYLAACGEYVTIQQNYDIINRKSKLGSLDNIEVMRKVQKECQLYLEQSKLDLMTGLLNKVSFEQTVGSLLQKRGILTSKPFAFAIVDLDHFKHINDTYGHIEGDKTIMAAVGFMTAAFDCSTVLGRIGGDEFGIFWPVVDSIDDAYRQLCHMQNDFVYHCKKSNDLACGVSISAGIMFSSSESLAYRDLFQRADNELYNAKAAGRGIICLEDY